jgi:hypothetical protein
MRRCVIALERTECVGAAPALDFCLEHVCDDFAGDPHAAAPSASAALVTAALLTAADDHQSNSPPRSRPALSTADHADVRLSVSSASSSIESHASSHASTASADPSRSVIVRVADGIVSATAAAAAAPLRALSASLSGGRGSSSHSRANSDADRVAVAASSAAPFDPSEDADVRRTRSAPAGPASAAASPPQPHALHRSLSDTNAAALASAPATSASADVPTSALRRFASAGRAAVAAVDSALAGVFKAQPPPFTCSICSDELPVEMRCALPCGKQLCADMCVHCAAAVVALLLTPSVSGRCVSTACDATSRSMCPTGTCSACVRCVAAISAKILSKSIPPLKFFKKYTRFKISKSNPNMRICSRCNALSEGR